MQRRRGGLKIQILKGSASKKRRSERGQYWQPPPGREPRPLLNGPQNMLFERKRFLVVFFVKALMKAATSLLSSLIISGLPQI